MTFTFINSQSRFNELMDRKHEIHMIFCLDDPDENQQKELNKELHLICFELKEYGLVFENI